VTLEGRIERLEREWDPPANLGPDPETVELWASLWTAVGIPGQGRGHGVFGFLPDYGEGADVRIRTGRSDELV